MGTKWVRIAPISMSFGQDCVAFHKGSESGLQIAPKGCKRVKKFKKLPSSCWRVLIFGRASVAVQVLQVQHRFLHLVGAASVAAHPPPLQRTLPVGPCAVLQRSSAVTMQRSSAVCSVAGKVARPPWSTHTNKTHAHTHNLLPGERGGRVHLLGPRLHPIGCTR